MASHFTLIMREGPHAGKTYELSDREITIGRDINADIVINIPEVSRRHVRLLLETGGYAIEDLGSTNGTFVNGQRVTGSKMLNHGDLVMLGEAVAFGYEGGQEFDPNATMVAPSSSAATVNVMDPITPPPSEPAYQAMPPRQVQSSTPAYSGQVPAGPVGSSMDQEPVYEDDAGGGKKTWLWAGIGCVAIVVCLAVVVVVAFDFLNLYCTPPFNLLFSCP